MKALLLAVLLIPGIAFSDTFSIAIKNDPETSGFYTGRLGPWTFKAIAHDSNASITCDGAPCPDQINENQTIIFTVSSLTPVSDLGFNIEFTSNTFVLADNLCFHTESYNFSSEQKLPLDYVLILTKKPQAGSTRNPSVDCLPFLQSRIENHA